MMQRIKLTSGLCIISIAIIIVFLFNYSPLFAAKTSSLLQFSSLVNNEAETTPRDLLRKIVRNAPAAAAPTKKTSGPTEYLEGANSLALVDDSVYSNSENGNKLLSWVNPSPLERLYLNKSADESIHVPVEDPMLSKQEPKWFNACDKRSAFNDTLIKIIVGSQSTHPAHAIEEDRKASGKFIKIENGRPTILATSERGKLMQPARPKRGTATKGYKDTQAPAMPTTGTGDIKTTTSNFSPFGVKRVGSSSSSSSVPSSALFLDAPTSVNLNNFYKYQAKKPASKSRGLYESHAVTASALINTNSKGSHQIGGSSLPVAISAARLPLPASLATNVNATKQLNNVMEEIFVTDVRISWSINCALNNANSAKKLISHLIKAIGQELNHTHVDNELVNQLIGQRREWLPNLDDLDVKNAARVESRELMANVSHYIQFVVVAIEQMVFEQAKWDKNFIIAYKELEKATLKILCEIDNLSQLLQSLKEGKDELITLMKINSLTDESLHHFETMRKINVSSVSSMGKRITYDKDTLESVYLNWLAKSNGQANSNNNNAALAISDTKQKVTNSTSNSTAAVAGGSSNKATYLLAPSFVQIGREVMPPQQRKLKSIVERHIRDQSLLENFEKVLNFYERILINIFV